LKHEDAVARYSSNIEKVDFNFDREIYSRIICRKDNKSKFFFALVVLRIACMNDVLNINNILKVPINSSWCVLVEYKLHTYQANIRLVSRYMTETKGSEVYQEKKMSMHLSSKSIPLCDIKWKPIVLSIRQMSCIFPWLHSHDLTWSLLLVSNRTACRWIVMHMTMETWKEIVFS
jgi:hypothetical protein